MSIFSPLLSPSLPTLNVSPICILSLALLPLSPRQGSLLLSHGPLGFRDPPAFLCRAFSGGADAFVSFRSAFFCVPRRPLDPSLPTASRHLRVSQAPVPYVFLLHLLTVDGNLPSLWVFRLIPVLMRATPLFHQGSTLPRSPVPSPFPHPVLQPLFLFFRTLDLPILTRPSKISRTSQGVTIFSPPKTIPPI